MKKRTLGIVLSLVMAMTLGVTAMAAPSKTVAGVVDGIEAVDAEDKDANIIVTEITEQYKEVAADIKEEATLKEVLGDDYSADLSVLDVVEIKVVGDATLIKWPVTMKLELAGVTKDTVIHVLHYENDAWADVPVIEKGNGYVKIKVNSLSPFAFVVDEDTLAKDSPDTGASTATTAVAMMVVIAAAGAVVLGKKRIAR